MSKKDWKVIWSMLSEFAKGHPLVIVMMVIHGVLEGIRPYIAVVLTGYLIDAVYQGASFELILRYALLGTGITVLISIIIGISLKYFNQNMEYMFEIQNGPLNKKSMEMDYSYLEDAKVHDSRQKINAFARFGLIGSALSHVDQLILSASSCIAAAFIVLPMFLTKGSKEYGFIGSPLASILFFIVLGVLIWSNYKVLTYYNVKHQEIRKGLSPFENRKKFYMDLLGNAEQQKDLRLNHQQALFLKETDTIIEGEKVIGAKAAVCMIKNGLTAQAVVAALSLIVYAFAGLRCFVGIITIGNVVTYAASISNVSESVRLFVRRLGYLKSTAHYTTNYVEFMSLPQHKDEDTVPMKTKDSKLTVEFENVSFRYPGSDTYVIKDLNLSLVIGEKMAIVGKNGSGKTTFIKLLCGLYEVTEGCIKVNGVDIRNYAYKEYCDLFAVVFQDFTMFDFPLGENLACSTEVDEQKALDALCRAGLEERMEKLKDGLNTYVGKGFHEDGVNFSGGEKQKMAIARAIYKDAPFVIMDEPTAALDPEAECEVFAGFDKMVGKKTAIYISHRLASCRFCEDILVFEKGKVVQRGSHDELVKQEGMYHELWNAQAVYYM